MTVYGISHCTCRSPPWMVISQIPALTAHISFLLWELIIWQTRSWQNYSHIKWQFHRFLWNSYFIPTLRAEHLADRSWQNYSHIKWQFHRFLLYSESSYLADQVLADHPLSNWNFTDCCSESSYFIPTLRAQHLADQVLADVPPFKWQFHWFLLWQLLFHSYPESLSFGRPGLGISTPHPMVIS